MILLFVFLLYCLLFVCYSDSLHFHFSVALIFSFHACLVLLFWIFFLFRFTSSSFLNIFTILFRSLSLLPISMLLFWFPHLKTCDYSRAKPLKLEARGLRSATLLKKRPWHVCFPVNFAKFLRTLFLHKISGRLLLNIFIYLLWTHIWVGYYFRNFLIIRHVTSMGLFNNYVMHRGWVGFRAFRDVASRITRGWLVLNERPQRHGKKNHKAFFYTIVKRSGFH